MSTLASNKAHCSSLAVLELHVDKITSETKSLGQALEAAEIVPMPCLKSLKVGGSVNSRNVLSCLMVLEKDFMDATQVCEESQVAAH